MAAVSIVAPFARVVPEARAALPPGARLFDTSADDEAYWRLLRDLWLEQEDILIIEHDIVVPPEILVDMTDCGHRWCAASYEFENWPNLFGLGCTRFSGRLMVEFPDALERVATVADTVHPARHWCSLDIRLTNALVTRGEKRATHGQVQHLSKHRGHTCG